MGNFAGIESQNAAVKKDPKTGQMVDANVSTQMANGITPTATDFERAGYATANAQGYHGGGMNHGSAAPGPGPLPVAPLPVQPAAAPAPAPVAAPPPPPPPPPSPAPVANTAPMGEGYGQGFGEQYGRSHIGQYDTPTDLETFAKQQLNGNNPYYARLQQEGMDRINQQMAARGHYNSGGALTALGNYGGALGAAQFKDMGDLLGSAGSAQMGRYAQGQSTANSIQAQQQQRMGQQWGQLSDIAHLGAGNVGGFFGQGGQMSGDAAMAGINAGVNASQLQGQGQSAFSKEGLGAITKIIGM